MNNKEMIIVLFLIFTVGLTEVFDSVMQYKESQYKIKSELALQEELSNRIKETEINTLRALALGHSVSSK